MSVGTALRLTTSTNLSKLSKLAHLEHSQHYILINMYYSTMYNVQSLNVSESYTVIYYENVTKFGNISIFLPSSSRVFINNINEKMIVQQCIQRSDKTWLDVSQKDPLNAEKVFCSKCPLSCRPVFARNHENIKLRVSNASITHLLKKIFYFYFLFLSISRRFKRLRMNKDKLASFKSLSSFRNISSI